MDYIFSHISRVLQDQCGHYYCVGFLMIWGSKPSFHPEVLG